jgi:hypothetical protein
MSTAAINIWCSLHRLTLWATVLVRFSSASTWWMRALLVTCVRHCLLHRLDLVLGSGTAADEVEDQSNERANQQEVNHRRCHMENEKTSQPQDNENREQDDEYW